MKKMFAALVCAVFGLSITVNAQEPATVIVQDSGAQSVVDSEAVLVSQDTPVEDTAVVTQEATSVAPVVMTQPYGSACSGCGNPAPVYTSAPYAAPMQSACCGTPAMNYAPVANYAPANNCCAPVDNCCDPCDPCCNGRQRGQLLSGLRGRVGGGGIIGRLGSRRGNDCCCY